MIISYILVSQHNNVIIPGELSRKEGCQLIITFETENINSEILHFENGA